MHLVHDPTALTGTWQSESSKGSLSSPDEHPDGYSTVQCMYEWALSGMVIGGEATIPCEVSLCVEPTMY
jgi:hypothetical protein